MLNNPSSQSQQINPQISAQIAEFAANKLPIEQAFKQLNDTSADNESAKLLCRELISTYTARARDELAARSEELDAANAAYKRAEDALLADLTTSFNGLLAAGVNDVCKSYLEELALSDLSGLAILSQTAQNAFIGLLEDGQLVYERASGLASYLLLNACRRGSAAQALRACALIIEPAIELANIWQSYAQELLRGCIAGLYEALELLAERAIKELQNDSANSQAQDFLSLETDFRSLIASCATSDFAGLILREIYDNELESIGAKFSRALARGRYVLELKFSDFGDKFSDFGSKFSRHSARSAFSSPHAGISAESSHRLAQKLQIDLRTTAKNLLDKLRK